MAMRASPISAILWLGGNIAMGLWDILILTEGNPQRQRQLMEID